MSLFFFSVCFLNRRFLRTLDFIGKQSRKKYFIKSLTYISLANTLTLGHCAFTLATSSSILQILILVLPFVFSKYVGQWHESTQAKDPTSVVKNCFISGFEIFLCAGFLPIRYLPSTGYYVEYIEYLSCLVSLLFMTNAIHLAHILSYNCAAFSAQAHHAGFWTKHRLVPYCPQWMPNQLYDREAIVSYKGQCWRAVGELNASEPGNQDAFYLHYLFSSPVQVYRRLLWACGASICLHWLVLCFIAFTYALLLSYLSLVYVTVRVLWMTRELVPSTKP
eukprot:CAMPEP_0204898874 /NCGR_PEP_ID=MMETSP1397-20131031/1531_1 /ASSEMBLY_ACC=CAM_ASM_000891 /TAXON_ID=49980 /ORGANISM="Climacostomum Climacostomum virens, Strain Stock W-24" /LENGTH=277 /DNA_ID=CAMNT_0052066761 /DNA_START=116 /DNA_END=949 /DNA_ORIENTATION=+